jgi:hypothetical protein
MTAMAMNAINLRSATFDWIIGGIIDRVIGLMTL